MVNFDYQSGKGFSETLGEFAYLPGKPFSVGSLHATEVHVAVGHGLVGLLLAPPAVAMVDREPIVVIALRAGIAVVHCGFAVGADHWVSLFGGGGGLTGRGRLSFAYRGGRL